MDYAEKLKHPKWQRRRLNILQRDNFTCQLCGDTETTLHVHHKFYIEGAEPWEYEDSDLITLCKDCHIACEFIIKRKRLLLNRLYKKYPTLFKKCPACGNRNTESYKLEYYVCTVCGFTEDYCNIINYEINAKN